MSLIDRMTDELVLVELKRAEDGEGGFTEAWAEVARFEGALTFNNSLEAKRAQADGVTSVYTLTTKKNVRLNYHDVFKRVSDGKTFRVTSDGSEKQTPEGAPLNMRQVSAEEWRLT